MAIIPTPAALKIRSIDWTLFRPSQVNRSAWTGRRQVVGQPGHSRWSAEVQLAPLQERDMRAMRSFLAQLRGQINTFRLDAVEKGQSRSAINATVVANAAAGANSFQVAGFLVGETLQPGQMMTVNDQLVIITASSGVADTNRTFQFEPALRLPAAAGTPVVVHRPTAHVALVDPSFRWNVGVGQMYGFSLSVEEVF